MSGRAQADGLRQIVVASATAGAMERPRRWIGRNMYLFSLCQQRETRQGIGVLSADERAHPADLSLLGTQIRRVSIGPGQLLGPRGDELAMAVQQRPLAIEQKIGVEKRSHAERVFFRDADREEHAVALGDLAQSSCLRSRNLHRVVKHSAAEPVLVYRSIDQVP